MFEIIMSLPFPFIPQKHQEGKQNLTTKILREWNMTVISKGFDIFVLFLYCRYIYTLYFMSDCYLGLDQQYDIHLNVTPASVSAQVNEEISDALTDLTVK